jgi:hypothetical protein
MKNVSGYNMACAIRGAAFVTVNGKSALGQHFYQRLLKVKPDSQACMNHQLLPSNLYWKFWSTALRLIVSLY